MRPFLRLLLPLQFMSSILKMTIIIPLSLQGNGVEWAFEWISEFQIYFVSFSIVFFWGNGMFDRNFDKIFERSKHEWKQQNMWYRVCCYYKYFWAWAQFLTSGKKFAKCIVSFGIQFRNFANFKINIITECGMLFLSAKKNSVAKDKKRKSNFYSFCIWLSPYLIKT